MKRVCPTGLLAGLLVFAFSTMAFAAETAPARGPANPAWLKAYRDHLLPRKLSGTRQVNREWSHARRLAGPTVNKADTTADDAQTMPSVANLGGGRLFATFADASPVPGANRLSSYAYSSNDGVTWTNGKAFPASPLGNYMEPVAAANRLTHEVYVANSDFTDASETIPVYRSTDYGQTFSAPVNGSPGFVGSGEFQLTPSITVDNFAGGGNGNVYLCWTDAYSAGSFYFASEVRFSRSTNHGATFSPSNGAAAPPIAVGGQSCWVAVSPNHQVNVFYYRGRGTGASANNKLFMRRSTNLGASFGPEILVATLKSKERSTLALSGGITVEMRPRVAINPVAAKPIIYVTYNDDPNPADPNDNAAIYYVRSANGGATWSAPILVTSAAKEEFAPDIAIPDAGGAPVISWYSFQDDASGVTSYHRRARSGTIAANGSIAFNGNTFRLGPNVGSGIGISFRNSMVGGASKVYAVWGDSRKTSTFNGNQQDIYFAAIRGPSLNADVSTTAAISTSSPKLGNTFTYTLTVHNGATAATDVVPAIRLNRFWKVVSVVPSIGTCWQAGVIVSCILSDMSANSSATVAVSVQPYIKAGAIGISSDATTSSKDVAPANNAVSTAVTVDGSEAQTADVSTGDVNQAIPDDGGATALDAGATLVPSSPASVVNLTLKLRIAHSFANDLRVEVIAPSGKTIAMKAENTSSGADFGTGATTCAGTMTRIDETAAARISSALPPFTGTFRPDGDLMAMMGENVGGDWRIRFTDQVAQDAGTVHCAILGITVIATPP
jgi:subtilisin-like proprotein convertase family protein